MLQTKNRYCIILVAKEENRKYYKLYSTKIIISICDELSVWSETVHKIVIQNKTEH